MPQTSPMNWMILSITSFSWVIMMMSNPSNALSENQPEKFFKMLKSWSW